MKKFFVLCLFCGVCSANFVWSAQKKWIDVNSDKGFTLSSGLLYNCEGIKNDPSLQSRGLNIAVILGYDFGRVSMNFGFDVFLLSYINYTGYGYSHDVEIKNPGNAGFMFNLGIKLINSSVFDLILPVGVLFRLSDTTVFHDNERRFTYFYLNVESGLAFSFCLLRTTNSLMFLSLPFNIGYPVYKKSKIKNYSDNGFNVLNYQAGFYLQFTFRKK